MNSRKFILQETGIIALGQLVCVAAMCGVFALLGSFDSGVVIGGIVGAVLAVGNFFFMAIAADMAADKAVNQDVKGGKAMIRSSYSLRLVVLAVILFAFGKSGICDLFALVLPLIFTRPILTIAEFFRKPGEPTNEC